MVISYRRSNLPETDYMSKKVPTTEPTRRSTSQSLASKTPMSAKMLPTFTTPSKPIYENESSSLAISKAMLKPIPKSERPWRQRMADAARLREDRGFDTNTTTKLVESRARRNSIGQKSGDELQTSLNALKDLVCDSTVDKNSALSKYRMKTSGSTDLRTSVSPSRVTFRTVPSATIHLRAAQLMSESYSGGLTLPYTRPSNVMSRSYSPIRTSRSPIWSGSSAFSNRDSAMPYTSRYSARDKSHETSDKGIKPITRSTEATIDEERKPRAPAESKEQASEKRVNPRSSRERTARRNSRQRSQSKSLSRVSSDEDAAPTSRDPPKKRRLRKRTASLPRENEKPTKDENATSTIVNATNSDTIAAKLPPTNVPETNQEAVNSSMYETPNDEDEPINNIIVNAKKEKEDYVESFEKTEEEFKSALSSLEILTMGNRSTKEPKQEERQIVPYKKSTVKKKLAEFKAEKERNEIPSIAPPEIFIPNDMPKIFNEVSPLSAVSPYSSFSMDAPLARDEISLSETISDTQSLILDDDDETKFNAVAEFKPKHLRRKKSPAPVPGVWIASTDEVNISRNKQLIKKDMEEISIECILAHIPLEQVVSPKIRATRRKLPEENRVLNAGFKCKASTKESAAITILGRKPVVIYKVSAHAREKRKVTPVTAIAVLNKDFANKKRLRLGIEKIFYAKGFKKELVKLSCKAALNLLTHIKLNVVQNEQAKAANVTVLSSDIMDVNWAQVKQRLKASVAPPTKKTLGEMIEKHAAIIVAEKEKLEKTLLPTKPPSVDEEDISSSSEAPKRFETHASIVLHRLRTADPGLVANSNNHLLPSDDYRKGDAIVLPDRSVLEEYVKRKRGQLERLQSEPLHAPSPLLSSRDVSPCHSTTSELQPACAVRIVEPPQRAVALITNPSRDRSRLSSVESTSVPPSSRNSNMLDIASYTEPTIRSNENLIAADFRAALKPRSRDSLIQLAVFDEPKSPFEAHLQNHATNLLRKSSTGTNIPANRVPENENRDHSVEAILSLSEGQHRRRSSVESITSMPPISAPMLTQTFTQAAALASQPRHERYAAHIPVNRSDTSGRQSTTSIDSNNSSSLDTASRQLDQMIDQARYRHHQHRAKFKEAIDYLDQIFEDLKKECEPPPATAADKKSEVPPPSSRGIQAAKAVFQKPKGQPTSPPTVKLRDQRRANPPLVSTHSLESNIQQQRPQPPPHRPEPIPAQVGTKQPLRQVQPPAQPNPSLPSFTNLHTAGPKPFPKDANNDIEVSETIVLPRKRSDRMDFTQKWLVDDIKSWADNPPTKPDLILNPNNQVWENGNDSDEHSIGSCSAEVAAINASDGRKKKVRETPDIIKSSKQYSAKKPTQTTLQSTNNAGPIRPQPFRPQPQYAFPSTSNTLNPNENNPYYGLQKVPSQDYITAVQQQQERAGSQEYQSIGSVHSQDGYKPPSSLSLLYSNSLNRTGAFIQYPQRGSIQSLPDANLMKPIPQRLPLQDPVLAIDALVAELELNTDQANVEKRRSFPTSSIADTYGSLQREYEKPKTSRPVVPKKPQAPSTLNVIKEPIQAGSMDRGMRRIQQQKASLDEVTNLLSTFANSGEMSPSTSSRASLQQQQIPKKIPVKPVVLEKNLLTPFETINAERINPSRVEAMQHIYKKPSPSQNSWRKNLPRNTNKDEENYYEINEFTVPTEKVINKTTVNQFSPPSSKSHRQQKDTTIIQPLYSQPNCFEYVPAFPVSQPPPGPPPGTSGSCGSANSGYYSSTSLAGNNPYNSSVSQKERPVSFRKPSISSRNGSFEDEEDDGFYDNIQVDHRRFSRGSELDNTSISSHRLPPTHKGSRLGQLIRRIGGGNSKPPGSAASLVSLNKAGIDHSRPIGLMKSNSLSNEPWNAQFITNKHESNKKNSQGFGQRIKQSIFGSRKRLNY
uniref:Uncharacterized protein n=1 Tax=Acrobeloides nanus TaxID=290746 RepID=A0A914C500_9BILA